MPAFLVDEDLPRSLSRSLTLAGFRAEDGRDVGLRGAPDDEVMRYAISHDLTLLSADLGFANVLRFPLGSHAGIVIARFPHELSTATLVEAILTALQRLSDDEIGGNLVIIEPSRIRLRRRP